MAETEAKVPAKSSAAKLSELLSVAIASFPDEDIEARVTAEFSPTATAIFKSRGISFADFEVEDQAPPPSDGKALATAVATGATAGAKEVRKAADARAQVSVMNPTFGMPVQSDLASEEAAVAHDVKKTAESAAKSGVACNERADAAMNTVLTIATDKKAVTSAERRSSKATIDSKGGFSCRCALF
jgi:hypothetical protein